jgi:hypothetical protein
MTSIGGRCTVRSQKWLRSLSAQENKIFKNVSPFHVLWIHQKAGFGSLILNSAVSIDGTFKK